MSHASAETPETVVLELLVRKSGKLLKQGVMKEGCGYLRKMGHSSQQLLILSQKIKCGLMKNAVSTT